VQFEWNNSELVSESVFCGQQAEKEEKQRSNNAEE
jgi:hypothetical protein